MRSVFIFHVKGCTPILIATLHQNLTNNACKNGLYKIKYSEVSTNTLDRLYSSIKLLITKQK